jgi:predicted ATPase with chaperone activity
MQPITANPKRTSHDAILENLVHRVNTLVVHETELAPKAGSVVELPARELPPLLDAFIPKKPVSMAETGLTDSEVEALVLKLLLARGSLSGRSISDHVKIPFVLLEGPLRQMKHDQLVVYRGSAPMNDYVYQLAEIGRERAKRMAEHCSYFGAAPVSLKDYIASVKAQSIADQHPTLADLQRAFEDLLIPPRMLARLGPAINSGRGFLLYGAPGNGKTSIAERVTLAFGAKIWIPRALGVEGEIIRLYDPLNHEEVPVNESEGWCDTTRIDQRWVRVRRPTIIAGGELTMNNLEVAFNTTTGISEAPLQLKSNCGTLVIDDFGRQRMSVEELLNRWIVPLEKRYDFLNLANGKKIQVPFDQLIIFSTNLEPRDLVDEAFLRRIPYKIEVTDPTEEDFRTLMQMMCQTLRIPYAPPVVDYLIARHYQAEGRPFRCCQPRDLLLQIRSHCLFHGLPMELTEDNIDCAVANYFSIM